ncbi:MAG: hypothetical protein AAF993_05270, partial [Pseudomonadota bacterium]
FLPGGSLGESHLPFNALNIPAEGGVIELETKPDDPYSVKIGAVVVDGELYIDPAPERRWYQHMVDNPDIRFRFDGQSSIYTARVYAVEEADIVSQFESGRVVLRLGPRL